MGKLIQTIRIIVIFALLLGSAAMLVLSLPSSGWKALSVQTGSMKPAIKPGDLVLAHRVPPADIKVGDVITYASPQKKGQTITHRVVEVLKSPNGLNRFVTKGDANPVADPVVYQNQIIGTTHATIPKLGFLFNWLRTWVGLTIVIYIPALLVVAVEIKKLARYYKEIAPYVASGVDPNKSGSSGASLSLPKMSALVLVAGLAIATPTVHAALMDSAALTGNTISILATTPPTPTPVNPLIYKVTFTSGSSSNGSTSNTNNVNVSVNNPQTATSGNATSSGGNATSGNASTSSNTSITINTSNNSTTTNGGGTTSQNLQSVTIYNPGDQAIDLAGWKLADNNGTQTIASGTVPAKGYFTFTWPVASGLDRLGDHLSLQNISGTSVDSLSWGTDTSQFNPSVATNNTTISLSRKTPALDSNTATDWSIQ